MLYARLLALLDLIVKLLQKLSGNNWVVFPLLLLFYTMFIIGGYEVARGRGLTWVRTTGQSHYVKMRISFFNDMKIDDGSTVFIGDSQFDFVEWSELIHGKVYNRAVNGLKLEGARIIVDGILEAQPNTIVFMCGINDLQSGEDLDAVAEEYLGILEDIADQGIQLIVIPNLPVNTAIYEQEIRPRHPSISRPDLDAVKRLHVIATQLSENNSNVHVMSVDEILSPDGELSSKFTFDGLHMTGPAAKKLAAEINTFLFPHSTSSMHADLPPKTQMHPVNGI